MTDSYRPVKFLDGMKGNNHIVLLYDSQKFADMIIARYLLNGLKKGESCICFTPEASVTVEKRLADQGIDVDLFKKASSLRIYSIERSDSNKLDALSILRGIRKEATKGMKPPYRFAGRTITDTGSISGMQQGMALERIGHEHFEEFACSQMCYYDISGIEPSMRDEWIRGLLKNHHQVIYASEPDRAVAFETMLLEDGE